MTCPKYDRAGLRLLNAGLLVSAEKTPEEGGGRPGRNADGSLRAVKAEAFVFSSRGWAREAEACVAFTPFLRSRTGGASKGAALRPIVCSRRPLCQPCCAPGSSPAESC